MGRKQLKQNIIKIVKTLLNKKNILQENEIELRRGHYCKIVNFDRNSKIIKRQRNDEINCHRCEYCTRVECNLNILATSQWSPLVLLFAKYDYLKK